MNYQAQLRAAGIGYLPLACPRHQSAGFEATIGFKSIDLTSSTLKAQIRLLPDSAGLLQEITIGTATLSSGDTLVPITLTQAEAQALPAPDETGDSSTLYWDMWVDGTVMLAGEFNVIAGVTQ